MLHCAEIRGSEVRATGNVVPESCACPGDFCLELLRNFDQSAVRGPGALAYAVITATKYCLFDLGISHALRPQRGPADPITLRAARRATVYG